MEGKTLNFERSYNTLQDISIFKDHSKTCIFSAFSFDNSIPPTDYNIYISHTGLGIGKIANFQICF